MSCVRRESGGACGPAANTPKLGADDAAAITAEDNTAAACVTQLLTQ